MKPKAQLAGNVKV